MKNKITFNRLTTFVTGQKGYVGLLTGLLLIPSVTLTLGTALVSREVINYTRVQQANDTAVLVLSKTDLANREAVLEHYMYENTAPVDSIELLSTSTSSSPSFVKADAHYKLSALYKFGTERVTQKEAFPKQTSAVVEYIARPLELVIALDNSASQGRGVIVEMVSKSLDAVFGRDFDSAGDVSISLLAYSEVVNLGSEFADDLIREDSRRLSPAGSKLMRGYAPDGVKSRRMFRQQKETLTKINRLLPGDLLAEGGPGSKYKICPVNRKPLNRSSKSAILAYVDSLDHPPSSESEKFELVVGDGRYFGEDYITRGAGTLNPWTGSYFQASLIMEGQYIHDDVRDLVLLPQTYYEEDPKRKLQAKDPDAFGGWFSGASKDSPWAESTVSVFGGSPKMRILAGSNNRQEIMDRMKDYGQCWTTGCDEAFTWGYRLLSPNWSKVWKKGAQFPAPYHGDTQKHLMLFLGFSNVGYNEVIPPICQKLADNGVKVSIFTTTDEANYGNMRELYSECAACGKDIGSTYNELSESTIYDAFAKMAKRDGIPYLAH